MAALTNMATRWGRLARSISASKLLARRLSTTSSNSTIIRSSVADIDLPTGNLMNVVLKDVSKFSEKTALVCSETGKQYTYANLVDQVARWGGALTKMGLSKGDVIATCMPNCVEFPIIMMGAANIGVVVTPINPSYTVGEVTRHLQDSNAKLLVGHPALGVTLSAALEKYKQSIPVIMNGPSSIAGAVNLHHLLEDLNIPFADTVELSGTEVCCILYSSGTTGPPKGVGISHNALAANVVMVLHPEFSNFKETTATDQESFLAMMPYFHIYGILPVMLLGACRGFRLVSVPKFDPNTFVKTMSDYKVETLHLVPSLMDFLLNSPTTTPEAMASVVRTLCGAAPVSQTAAIALVEKMGKNIKFQEGYGMTEVLLSNVTPISKDVIGRSGALLPNVSSKIVDLKSGETLPLNQIGEVCIKSPSIMNGYCGNLKATLETIDSEGWVHSGDVGHYDEDGILKVVDRTKELIKVKSIQVSPSELEDVLRKHPAVAEVGVVGVPHERLGEAPRAYIVSSSTVSDAEIHKFMESRVAPHKRLAGGVEFIEELPKTGTGKLLRRELRQIATN